MIAQQELMLLSGNQMWDIRTYMGKTWCPQLEEPEGDNKIISLLLTTKDVCKYLPWIIHDYPEYNNIYPYVPIRL